MKAIVQDRYGSPDVLEFRDTARPSPGAGEVLVRVHAAGVDPGVRHLTTGHPYLVRRGLHHLVMNTETSANLKLKVLNVSKRDLFKDVDRAVEFDQSQVFKKLYENEFGSPGGEPYGTLIGDYEFSNHPEDVELLSKMSNVAAAAFCPFLSAASSSLFGFEDWEDLSRPRDLEKIFDSIEYAKWRSFRDSEDSRFVTLVMP